MTTQLMKEEQTQYIQSEIKSKQESIIFAKKMFAISISFVSHIWPNYLFLTKISDFEQNFEF